jgi:hypothetical protein
VVYANTLLAQVANQTVVSGGYTYVTSLTEYTGSVSGGIQDKTKNTSVPAGWEYVLAKYDGPNGGSVLWYLGGASIMLPSTSEPLFHNVAGQGYEISHFTVFNPIPEPSTYIAGGLLLIPLLAQARRWKRSV